MKILKLSIPFIYTLLHIICTHINEWQFSHFLWMLETMMLSFRGLFISIWYILDEIGPWSFNCRYNVVCCFKLIVTIFWSVLHKQLLLTNIDIIFYNLIVVRVQNYCPFYVCKIVLNQLVVPIENILRVIPT